MNPYLDGNEIALRNHLKELDASFAFEAACEREKESLMKLTLAQLEDSINGRMWIKFDELLEEVAAEIVMDSGEPDDPEVDQPEPEWR